MTSKELRETRNALFVRIDEMRKKIEAENRNFTAEEEANWKQVNADYDGMTQRIQTAERAESLESQQRDSHSGNQPGRGDFNGASQNRTTPTTDEQRALALQGWCLRQCDKPVSEEHIEAAKAVGVALDSREYHGRLFPTQDVRSMYRAFRNGHSSGAEQRAMSAILGSAGGITVPTTLAQSYELALLQFGGVRQVAEIIRTDGGGEMTWPSSDDTSNTGELIGENTTVGTQDVAVKGTIWNAYKWSSKMVKVPFELLQDSAFDLGSVIGQMLGERIGRARNTYETTGTGAAQPNGIVTASTAGVTAASGTAIAADEVFDLIHSVDPAYRMSGAGFMFHDNILLHLRKLKDGGGQYLWASGLNGGVADTLAGYPYTINQDMQSSVATTTKTMLFGQLNKYKIRDVNDFRLKRLEERYAELDQVAFIAFMRGDGNLLNAGTNPVKHLVQA